MQPTEPFLHRSNELFSPVANETNICASDILDGRFLYKGLPKSGQQELASRFLRGMTVNIGKGKWEMTMQTVAEFRESHLGPMERIPETEVLFESNYTSSRAVFERKVDGINEAHLSVSSPFVSVETSVAQSNSDQHSSSSSIVYSVARVVRRKKEIEIEVRNLRPSEQFKVDLYNIVIDRSSSLQRARNLVELLNKYGWYVPTRYIMGGAFIMHSSTSTSSTTDIAKWSLEIKAKLEGSYSVVSASVGGSHKDSTSTTNTRESESRNEEKTSIGANGALDVETFLKNVENSDNWKIVQYVDFYPTLLLLQDNSPWILTECIKLLRNNYYRADVANLQKFIDIHGYMLNLDTTTSPIPF